MKKLACILPLVFTCFNVLAQNEPDLSVRFIKRLPEINYVSYSANPTVEGWPAAGQAVQWRAHVRNWSANNYSNISYEWKKNGNVVKTGTMNFPPNSDVAVTLDDNWAFQRDSITFTVDNTNLISETSEANNSLQIYTNAISVNFYVEQTLYDYFHTYQNLLGVQTNSWDDWIQMLQVKRFNLLFQNAIFPETPNGVIDRIRVDSIVVVPDQSLPLAGGGIPSNYPNLADRTVDLQWGFPSSTDLLNSYANHTRTENDNPFFYQGSLLHELGHARYLIDLYGFDISMHQVRINEGNTPIAGSPLMPILAWDVVYYNKWKSFMSGNFDYSTISIYETLALNRIAHRRAICGNYNSPCNIGEFINDLPASNTFKITDQNNSNLSNACVEIYQAQPGSDWYGKDFDDTPDLKFTTNENGEVNVGKNPFTMSGFLTTGYGYSNMDIIMRVEKNNKVGYTVVEAADFNVEYWKGNVDKANYAISVNMLSCADFSTSACTCAPPPAALSYKYYEGSWTTLPDFNSLTPVKTGNSANFDISLRTPGRSDNFAFVWQGYIKIPVAGVYTFGTISDDGSKFYFNTLYNPSANAIVNNDGIHAPTEVKGSVTIPSAGVYPVTVTYFEKDGGEQMHAYWTVPGSAGYQLIPDSAFTDTPPAKSNGLAYKYYEGTWNTLPDFSTLTPVKTGNSDNVDITVRTADRNDNFAFVWQGYINIPTAGNYTFETVSDDGSKFYFNSLYVPSANPTVNNDGLHAPVSVAATVNIPAPGVYPVSITYFEKDGGEQMQLYWAGPGISRQLIPNAAFTQTPPSATNGLAYKYYEGSWTTLPDFNALTPVKTGNSDNVDITLRTPDRNDNFAFVWQGYINIPTAGNYTFETISDDGSKLYFNTLYNPSATATVNNDGIHAPLSAIGTINIPAAGSYPISITFFEKDGGEQMQVYWTGPGITRQLIPNSVFTSQPSATVSSLNQTAPVTGLSDAAVANIPVIKVYPNPFNKSFIMDFYNSSPANDIHVNIYDLKGRLVYTQHSGNTPKGNSTLKINLDHSLLSWGMYMAELTINGVPSKMVKLVKVK